MGGGGGRATEEFDYSHTFSKGDVGKVVEIECVDDGMVPVCLCVYMYNGKCVYIYNGKCVYIYMLSLFRPLPIRLLFFFAPISPRT